MSEENQENGTTNGSDVPEIELIIKDDLVVSKATTEEEKAPCTQQQQQELQQEEKKVHQQQPKQLLVQSIVYKIRTKPDETKNINNIYLTFDNEKLPSNIFVHFNCDEKPFTNGNVMQDNNEVMQEYKDVIQDNKDVIQDNNKDVIQDNNRDVTQDNNNFEVLMSKENLDLKCNQPSEDNNNQHVSSTSSSSSSSSPSLNHDENKTYQTHCDSDSVNHMNFESVVAEACDGLFEDIENDLDLNLKEEPNAAAALPHHMEVCECGGSGYVTITTAKKEDSEAMQMAVAAVLNEGLSLGQAAKKYSVTKSTIWSRVSKHPKHRRRKINKELAEIIHSKLSAGESLSEISRSLNVAKSTVHQHKARLTKHGQLPTVLILKKDRENNANGGIQDRLMQAYRGCRVNGMSVRFAADFYSVPLTTLWRYIKRNQAAAAQKAQPKIVSAVEDKQCNSSDASNDEENEQPPAPVVASSALHITKAEKTESATDDDVKPDLNPEDQQLFEDTYLNHLFE